MPRLALAAAVAAVTVLLWWLTDEGRLGERLSGIGARIAEEARGGPPPNWGDVADRVGEFAREERELKGTVAGSGADADPSPAE